MRRDKGLGYVYRRGKSWYFRLRVGKIEINKILVDPATVKRAETKAHAYRIASLEAGRFLDRPERAPAVNRLEDLDAEYVRAFPCSLHPNSWKTRAGVMRVFQEWFPAVADINHAALGEFVSWRLKQPSQRGRGTITPATVNRELAFLRRLLTWGANTGRIERNPMAGFRMLREHNSRERVLSDEEVQRLMAALRQPRFADIRLIVEIALFCGMRRGEVFGLRWVDVNERERVFDLLFTKSGRRRKVPIPGVVWEELMKRPRESEWIFPSPKTGGCMDNIRKSWASLMREAQIEGFTFHDLRHTAATRMAENCDLKTLMEILGHSNPRTALRYQNPDLERRRRAVEGWAENCGVSGEE
ncbi:MAG: tyrosine-type recombinase/integrase [bacterium]